LFGFSGSGEPGRPGGTQGNQTNKFKKNWVIFVDFYVGNKSALLDHLNLSIDGFVGMGS